jgi:hypothetical protein
VWVGFDTGEHDEICSIVKPISPVSRSLTIVDFIGTTPAIKSDGWLVIAGSSLIIGEKKNIKSN